MKAYLFTSGTVFALFAAIHLFITYEHWRRPSSDPWSVLAPALIFVASASLALWGFRLTRGAGATAA